MRSRKRSRSGSRRVGLRKSRKRSRSLKSKMRGGSRSRPTSGHSSVSFQKNASGGKTKYKEMTCSPLSTEYKNGDPLAKHETCLPDKVIIDAKKKWNAKNPSKKITATNPREIWNKIKSNIDDCDNDLCIFDKSFMEGAKVRVASTGRDSSGGTEETIDLKDYYSPMMPKEWKNNPTEWLSNVEILQKMKQYEEAYKCFKFIGPAAIDFDTVLEDKKCVDAELCNFQLANYINRPNKIKKIGIIFNTDPHDKGGSHWISLFIDIPKKIIFFFDSAGDEAPKQVVAFVERVKSQGLAMNPPIDFKFDQNYPKEHQFSTTECGMYSLYFIINMLEDKLTPEALKTSVITDKQMIENRKKYFNDI